MKKFLATLLASLYLLPLFLVLPAVAASSDYGLSTAQTKAGLPTTVGGPGGNTIPGIVGKVVAAGLSLIGIVFFLLVLYAGFIWMKARGNTEEIDKAKSIIEGAIIGLVLVTAAYAISNFVFGSLTKVS